MAPAGLVYADRTIHSEMGFGNLKAESGLQALNDFLADKSYIEG